MHQKKVESLESLSQGCVVLSMLGITWCVMAQCVFVCPNNWHVKVKLKIFTEDSTAWYLNNSMLDIS